MEDMVFEGHNISLLISKNKKEETIIKEEFLEMKREDSWI